MPTAADPRTGFIVPLLVVVAVGWNPAPAWDSDGSGRTIIDGGELSGEPPEAGTLEVTPLVCAGGPPFPPGRILRFAAPIEPWTLAGLGWGEEALDRDGGASCQTNAPPAITCDPSGPRPFVHAGFDAAPAPDRSVLASAPGRVVAALHSLAPVTGLGTGVRGGVVVLEHDPDGDPATLEDRVLTVYSHVDPLVAACGIIEQGQLIARTTAGPDAHLHFAVQRAPFVPGDPDVFREILPPAGTSGCLPCAARPLPLPAFPGAWEDPERLLRAPEQWSRLYSLESAAPGDILEVPGGYVVAGWTRAANIGNTGADDIWLLGLDPQGRILTQAAYGGPGIERGVRLTSSADGGFALLATGRESATARQLPILLKFQASGDRPQWQKAYIATGLGQMGDVKATADGGYVIAGPADHGTSGRATVLKVDSQGVVQWARFFPSAGPGFQPTTATSIVQAEDGGYVVLGEVRVGPGERWNLLIFRLDASGNLVWASTHVTGGYDEAGQIEKIEGGKFAIVSSSQSGYLRVLTLLADGSIDWEAIYYHHFYGERGNRIVPTADGGFVVAGGTGRPVPGLVDHDAWVMKLDATGEIIHQQAFDGRGIRDETGGLRATRDGGVVLTAGGLGPGLLVVKTGANMEVPTGCGRITDGSRIPWSSTVVSYQLQQGDLNVTASSTDLSVVPTAGRDHACADGNYGPPPNIESSSVQLFEERTQCDVTRMFLDYLCTQGLEGFSTINPVVIDGTYSVLEVSARVTDADTTAQENDVSAVQAELVRSFDSPGPILDLQDDGSLTAFVQEQIFPIFPEDCFEDPVQGSCTCREASYDTYSHDEVAADTAYSRAPALFTSSPLFLPLQVFLMDCVMAARGREPLLYPDPEVEREVVLRATDRQGNVTTWPAPTRVTVAPSTATCSGDDCLCCVMFSHNPAECAGRSGLISPDFPDGICRTVLGASAGP